MDNVVLVNSKDQPLGVMEKLKAHQTGALHRAFSVLIFNSKGEILLQKRADSKYHSGGLWTNACCSHPLPDESTQDAAERRLAEEMGIKLRPDFAYKFIYKASLDNQLIEHEYDHVFIGYFDGEPTLNRQEASAWKYLSMNKLKADVAKHPEHYTVWFKIILDNLDEYISEPSL